VGVTGQERMLSPPKHLILSSHLLEDCVALHSICNCLLDYDYVLQMYVKPKSFAFFFTNSICTRSKAIFKSLHLNNFELYQ
jgi:hypothetical protein